MRHSIRASVLAAVGLALGSCNWYYDRVPSPDDLVKLVPWFDHMITSPAVHPYERIDIPRRTVPGTVPIDASEGDWSARWSRADYAVADRLVNPVDPADPVLAAVADTLFHVYCAVCHGPTGAANGPVSPKIGAPSLLTVRARALTDGHIYSVIRYGRGLMFPYGDKIVEPDYRWALVHYVRRLQATQPAPPPGVH